METLCKRCLEFNELGDNLHLTIKRYIDSLDEEQKTSQEVYEKRLLECEKCDSLINGLCKYCGCFVLARTAKKNQYCPYPQNKKW